MTTDEKKALDVSQTIPERIITVVNEYIGTFGEGHIITTHELKKLMCDRYGIKEGSVIPSDYCYNRVNDGIKLSWPTLFEQVATGRYRCLGENYPYNGDVYHKEFIVGKCENGTRRIYGISDTTVATVPPRDREQNRRDPSKRLRFQVLVRDKSTCRLCGASPTKDPSVTLHIDHIIPWSKGGKTTLDNLQTLCAACNLGKSDIIIE